MTLTQTVYYITGMRGRISEGLGRELTSRGLDVSGRELSDDFPRLPFQDQVDAIAEDLVSWHWRDDARVIANSFGAYLFLHAQAQLPRYIGKVLLLSPIVGGFVNDQVMRGFIPPRSRKLAELIQSGAYPCPIRCEIHVGAEDWQSNPDAVRLFADSIGAKLTIVERAGHSLPHEYVHGAIDQWLQKCESP